MKRSTSRDSANRHGNVYARGVLSMVDDTMPMQILGFGAYSQEQQQQIEHAEPYGYSSVANLQQQGGSGGSSGGSSGSSGALGDQAGPEHFTSEINSGRSHGVTMHVPDRRYRLKNKKPGEVSVYDWQGQWLYLRAGSMSGSGGSGGSGGSSSPQGGQMFGKVPNSFSIKFQIDQDQQQGGGSSGGGSSGSSGSSGGSQQLGQDASQIPQAYAYHQIDKNSRTVQHPQLIQHQVTDSNGNPQHQVIIQTGKGITESTQNDINHNAQGNINRSAQQTISDTANDIVHNGETDINGSLDTTQDITAPGYLTGSDISIKENVRPFEDALKLMRAIKVKRYARRLDAKESLGVIAQELLAILPELVSRNKKTGLLGVHEAKLGVVALAAVQALDTLVATLEQRLTDLEGAV